MTKDETTKAIEKAGKKIEKEIVKSPLDKDRTEQMMTKVKEDLKKNQTESPQIVKKDEVKIEEKKPEKEKVPEKNVKPKKTEAVVNAKNVPISTKHSSAICKFIKRKRIPQAISDLEQVIKIRKAVPMKGEIPHRKGKGMMSGRFPQKAAKEFIILLKSLGANANYNGIENPIIVGAKANIGARPFGKYGIRRKRTHITITAKTFSKGKK